MQRLLCILIALSAMTAHATSNPEPAIRFADSGAVDAFGRLRVSTPTSQVHIEQYFDKNPLLIDEELIGTATATFQANESRTVLATSADLDVAIQQTFNSGQYQSGQSQHIKMTFVNLLAEANVTKRAGYYQCNTTTPFNSNCDGIWISSEGGTYYTNVYRNGTAVSRTARAAWADPMDGTGPSGVTLDFSKGQILDIDFQWLGLGRVRWYWVVDGLPIQFHTDSHAGAVTIPYMRSPNHPLRWEVRQSGAGSGSFSSVCGEISTEGPLEFIGTTRSADNGNTEVSGAADTKYALVGLSIQSTKDSLSVIPTAVSVISTDVANKDFRWSLCLNPTVAGTFNYSAVTNSPAEVAIGVVTNTVSDCTPTDGKMIASGYGTSSAPFTLPTGIRRAIGHSIDGVQDEVVLVVEPLAAAAVAGSVTWEERY